MMVFVKAEIRALDSPEPRKESFIDFARAFLLRPMSATLEHMRTSKLGNFFLHHSNRIAAAEHVEGWIARTADEEGRLLDLASFELLQEFKVTVVIAVAINGAAK